MTTTQNHYIFINQINFPLKFQCIRLDKKWKIPYSLCHSICHSDNKRGDFDE